MPTTAMTGKKVKISKIFESEAGMSGFKMPETMACFGGGEI